MGRLGEQVSRELKNGLLAARGNDTALPDGRRKPYYRRFRETSNNIARMA